MSGVSSMNDIQNLLKVTIAKCMEKMLGGEPNQSNRGRTDVCKT